jgi:ornithine carbamoyltransferase
MDVALAYPEGYELIPDVVDRAREQARVSGGSLTVGNSMEEAFAAADIVYPKSWAPFHVMQKRTGLLQTGDRPGLAELERQCLAENARHQTWECDEKKMAATNGGKALYMHCLPADISGVSCAHGEVAASVFERYRIATYRQAGFKPFVIAALIFLTRMGEPVKTLDKLVQRSKTRAI